MSSGMHDLIEAKRKRAAFHEGSHFSVGLRVSNNTEIIAHIGKYGGGDCLMWFPPDTSRADRLLAAVAGFLGEAKGASEKRLNADEGHVRIIAVDIDRRLRAGEQAFQVDVLMNNGETEPATTNQKDFAFLLEDFNKRSVSFKTFFGRDLWANEIQEAITRCIAELETSELWIEVEAAAKQLLDESGIETNNIGHLTGVEE